MKLHKWILVGAVWSIAHMGSTWAANEPGVKDAGLTYHKQKVVYHINDAQTAGMALRNVQNHINAVGEGNAEIVVVTHGAGIDFLLDDWKDTNGKSYDSEVQELANRGVKFDVCRNTLKGRKLGEDKINMNATVVPSGVATLGELQMQGFVYVKP
jgi:intracellular sulfur oxidation DsrE/DsrF family protein